MKQTVRCFSGSNGCISSAINKILDDNPGYHITQVATTSTYRPGYDIIYMVVVVFEYPDE